MCSLTGSGRYCHEERAGYQSVEEDYIRAQLSLRRPVGDISTPRQEPDRFVIDSGVYRGKTTGTPLSIRIPNENVRSGDYSAMEHIARPGHADYTGYVKYRGCSDPRGGGHFSGRVTAALVAAGAIVRYALEQKRAGRIRCIGLSSHNPEVALAAVESGLVEVLMFSVNPCYDLQPAGENCEALWAEESYAGMLVNMDPARERLYETCQRLGVGITVMKAFGGGDLLTADSPAGVALTVEQCIHYALTRPAVASVMSGVHTSAELAASLAYETAPDSARDYAAALATFPKISWRGHCMYCGHCAPCPKGIDVASVTKFLNLARAQGMVPETVREHYAALAHKAGECIACGACSKRCPFGVDAVENMRRAEETFGA